MSTRQSGTARTKKSTVPLPTMPAKSAARAVRPRIPVNNMAVRRLTLMDRSVPYGLLIAAMFVVIWQMKYLHGYTYADWHGFHWSDYDEGVYLSSAQQLNNGAALFSQVFSSQPALFLVGLAATLQIAGGSADAGHLYALLCGLLASGGVVWLCWEIAGRWAALVAMVLLALSPGFELAAHAVEAEAPMLALGSIATAAAARYAKVGAIRWLVIACLLLAGATLSKLLAVVLIAPIGVAVLLKWLEYDRLRVSLLVKPLVIGLSCFMVPIVAVFALLSPAAQWDQVVRFHLKASEVYARSPFVTDNRAVFEEFVKWDPGLMAFAVAGLAIAAVMRMRLALIPLTWFVATIGSLVSYHPLFVHHLTVALPPLAALAGLSAALFAQSKAKLIQKIAVGTLLVCAALVYAIWLPVTVDHTRSLFAPDSNPVKLRQIAWLKAHSAAGDVVVVDDQMLAVGAGRLVPPALTDTSGVRDFSSYLPLALLEKATVEAQARAVLLTRALYDDAGYLAWLRRHYQEVHLPSSYPHTRAFSLAGTSGATAP